MAVAALCFDDMYVVDDLAGLMMATLAVGFDVEEILVDEFLVNFNLGC